MTNNLTKKEQQILFAEIESIIKSKIDLNPAVLVIEYIANKDGFMQNLAISDKDKNRNFVGVEIKIRTKLEENEDKISLKLVNGFIINSSYKAFIQNEFDEGAIPSLVYICFFDVDEYRRYCNHKVNEVILKTDKDKELFYRTIANPREPNEALKNAYSKMKETFEE